jgi:hypothetical protein
VKKTNKSSQILCQRKYVKAARIKNILKCRARHYSRGSILRIVPLMSELQTLLCSLAMYSLCFGDMNDAIFRTPIALTMCELILKRCQNSFSALVK